jgi:pilus assembly protein CpaB
MNRRIVLIAVAVVLALFGTFAVYSYAHNADERAVAGGRAVQVLVATGRVTAGTSWADAVKSGNMKVENMPASSAPQSALSSLQAPVSKTAVAQSDIAPGQVVLREAFGAAVSQTGIISIPKGMIALSVSLDSNANVAGYVGPHSQVVIFETAKLGLSKAGGAAAAAKQNIVGGTDTNSLYVTKTVVSKAEVIATSASTPTTLVGGDDTNGASSNTTGTTLVTLAVSQANAERLVLAQQTGSLYLGLLSSTSRTSTDSGVMNTGDFKPARIYVK